MCELCSRSSDGPYDSEKCEVCNGHRYYLWDPETKYCFLANGEPLTVQSEGSETLLVRETTSAFPVSHLTVDEMLFELGEWASEDTRRKFKLWFNKDWKSYLWTNRFDPCGLTFCSDSLHVCVRNC